MKPRLDQVGLEPVDGLGRRVSLGIGVSAA